MKPAPPVIRIFIRTRHSAQPGAWDGLSHRHNWAVTDPLDHIRKLAQGIGPPPAQPYRWRAAARSPERVCGCGPEGRSRPNYGDVIIRPMLLAARSAASG